ncbi:MAG: hypothetical protein PHV78_02355 [Patescibacteria group bacterium]|nr:hypothetical protein [Patescibacteria group bacterium]MDD5121012.1 hypothetical protein [Patescibacteria group bacterium]MDD5221627.1 hypothetical protein [Patescibacteria group bacterium]MDD5396069.1 hypothetical protein [Patescibacteria group bacterium]
MDLQTLDIDFSPVLSILQQPPELILWNIFIYGGWVILLILIFIGAWDYWVFYIRRKYRESLQYILLTIDVPKNNEQGPETVERLFAELVGARSGGSKLDIYFKGYIQSSFSFELVSLGGHVRYFIRLPAQFRDMVEAAIYSAYPEAQISEVDDYTAEMPDHFPDEEYDCWASDLILYNKEFYPIRTYPSFEHSLSKELKDPLGVLLELMSKLQSGEQLWMQLILTPISNDWKKQADNFVKKMLGIKVPVSKSSAEKILEIPIKLLSAIGGIFFTAPEATKKEEKKEINLSPGERKSLDGVQNKASKTGFKVKFRTVYVAKKEVFSKNRGVVGFLGAINQFNTLDMNGFKPDDKAKTSKPMFFGASALAKKQTSLMRAYKQRDRFFGAKNFILNVEELATLYHFPVTISSKVPLIKKTGSKRAEPPLELPTG